MQPYKSKPTRIDSALVAKTDHPHGVFFEVKGGIGPKPSPFVNISDECAVSLRDWLIEAYPLPKAASAAPLVLPERKRTEHLAKDARTMTAVRAGLEAYNRALDDVAALNADALLSSAEPAKGGDGEVQS